MGWITGRDKVEVVSGRDGAPDSIEGGPRGRDCTGADMIDEHPPRALAAGLNGDSMFGGRPQQPTP